MAANLSRMRSPVSSRSNWAKLSSTFSISRPMQSVVLNDWVTETNETAVLIKLFGQLGKIHQRAGEPVDFVDDDDIDLAGADQVHEPGEGRAIHVAAREPAVVEMIGDQRPAFMRLGFDVAFAGLALRFEAS